MGANSSVPEQEAASSSSVVIPTPAVPLISYDHEVNVTVTIAASSRTVWPLLADVRMITKWHPSVPVADLLTSEPTGLGAARRCHVVDGTTIREDIVEISEGRQVKYVLSEYSMPLERGLLIMTIDPTSDNQCDVRYGGHHDK